MFGSSGTTSPELLPSSAWRDSGQGVRLTRHLYPDSPNIRAVQGDPDIALAMNSLAPQTAASRADFAGSYL